jgi:hypothetical protein
VAVRRGFVAGKMFGSSARSKRWLITFLMLDRFQQSCVDVTSALRQETQQKPLLVALLPARLMAACLASRAAAAPVSTCIRKNRSECLLLRQAGHCKTYACMWHECGRTCNWLVK